MKAIIQNPKGIRKIPLFKFFGRLNLNIDNFNARFSVKREGGLMHAAIAVFRMTELKLTARRIRLIFFLLKYFRKIYRDQGPTGTIRLLKSMQVAMQQALGGHRVRNLALISKVRFARNRMGLPKAIPREMRLAIRQGDVGTMRFIFSVFAFFRVLDMPGKPDLSTISAPNNGDGELIPVLRSYMDPFLMSFVYSRFSDDDLRVVIRKAAKLFPIFKAAPGLIKEAFEYAGVLNYSTHPVQLLLHLRALKRLGMLECVQVFARWSENEGLQIGIDMAKDVIDGPSRNTIGKLSVKEESAGKVRVFAIVDAWTQWALAPLHHVLFHILRDIPMDGTFDQLAPLKAMFKSKSLYSLDLTAATDRMPIAIQIPLLEGLFGHEVAANWAKLLTGRNYGFYALGYSQYHGQYRYAVGQPMGALSSWAMLAFTHHFLVQSAAWLSGNTKVGLLYTNYAVLGDDLVIGDADVKDSYLLILKSLGMDVNVHKSILSDNGTCLEFAKRTFWKGKDVSPYPLKELNAAMGSIPAAVEFMRKYSMSLLSFLKVLRFGWKTLTWLNKPLGDLPAQVRALWLALRTPTCVAEVPLFFELGAPKVARYAKVNLPYIERVMLDAIQAVKDRAGWIQFRIEKVLFPPYDSVSSRFAKSLTYLEEFGPDTEFFRLAQEGFYHGDMEAVQRFLDKDFRDLPLNHAYKDFFDRFFLIALRPSLLTSHADMNKIMSFPLSDEEQEWDGERAHMLFMHLIRILGELAIFSDSVFKFARPEGIEGKELSRDEVTPAKLRFYRKWSGLFQGSVNAYNTISERAAQRSKYDFD